MKKTNIAGDYRYEYVKRNFKQMMISIPLTNAFLIWMVYLSLRDLSLQYFYSMLLIPFLMLILSIYSILRMLKRQNRTITEIEVIEDIVLIKTNKIFWMKELEFKINKSILNVKSKQLDWYGKIPLEGVLLKFETVELYLVKEYFDDYDEIVKLLN